MGVRVGKVSVKCLAINPWQMIHLSYGLSTHGTAAWWEAAGVRTAVLPVRLCSRTMKFKFSIKMLSFFWLFFNHLNWSSFLAHSPSQTQAVSCISPKAWKSKVLISSTSKGMPASGSFLQSVRTERENRLIELTLRLYTTTTIFARGGGTEISVFIPRAEGRDSPASPLQQQAAC